MRLIDSHCHLNYEGLVERQDEVLDSARARGVGGFLNISTRQTRMGRRSSPPPSAMPTSGRASASTRTRPTPIPISAPRRWSKASDHPKVVAIGECGLDYYYDKSDRAAQRERFEAHIEAARATGLPLIVHTRDAEEDTAEILGAAVQAGRRHRRAPLLHRQRRAGPQGAGPRLLHLAVRDRHLQERPRPAGNREAGPARPAAGRDRLRRSSRRCRTAARPASRRSSPTPPPSSPSCAARRSRRWPRRPPPISSGCSARRAA